MDKQVFRQKSIDRISSPEQMHDYMRVTSPRLWMLLTAIIVLVAGGIVAAATFTMENTLPVKILVERYPYNEEKPGEGDDIFIISAEIPNAQKDQIEVGQKIRFAGYTAEIAYLFSDAEQTMASLNVEESLQSLKSGEYDGELIVETTTPFSYLLK